MQISRREGHEGGGAGTGEYLLTVATRFMIRPENRLTRFVICAVN
jgi:hypothetical protein